MHADPGLANYEELRDAVCAVRSASRVTRRLQANLGGAFLTKEDRSPVTVADYAAQALVSLALPPDESVVGEETSADLETSEGQGVLAAVTAAVRSEIADATGDQVRAAIDRCAAAGGPKGRFWVLDPIDGTKGFLRGDQYAIALGLIEEGEVVGGILGCPNLPFPSGRGCLFVSLRGQGAWELPLDEDGPAPRRVAVSPVSESSDAVFCESAVSMHSDRGSHAEMAARLGVTAAPVRMDSQCKYGAIARGDASIYLRLPAAARYREKVWDHAAGFVVVTEAGGRVTDARGRELDFSLGRTLAANRGVVATNGLLHREVLAAAAAVLPEAPAA